jgi:hypothetical protein
MSVNHRELLGVYPDRQSAERVADALKRRGVDPGAIHIGDARDEADSLLSEMDEEVSESWGSPAAPPIVTKEMVKGGFLAGALGAIIGALVLVPAAFLFGWKDTTALSVRVAVVMGIGASLGLTIGWVVGGGWSVRRDRKLAAERGVTVRVETARDDVRSAMESANVLRLDELDGRQRVRTITTEERREVHNPVEDAKTTASDLAEEIKHGEETTGDRSPR